MEINHLMWQPFPIINYQYQSTLQFHIHIVTKNSLWLVFMGEEALQ